VGIVVAEEVLVLVVEVIAEVLEVDFLEVVDAEVSF
jgi:hypothetical protein